MTPRFRAPNVFVLISAILLLVAALTWVVPSGQFQREERQLTVGTRSVVVPGSYAPVDPNRQTPWDVLMAPMRGFEQAAEVVGFILLVGGAFGVLSRTGSITRALAWLTRRAEGWRFAAIPVLMFAFSLGGALFGMAEETIIFALITIPLAVMLRFDVLTGIAIPFVGSQAGFSAAFVNPFTLGIAKGIAEQPLDEGKGYRVLCWFVVTSVCTLFVWLHARRVARDPARSPTASLDAEWRARVSPGAMETEVLAPRDILVLAAFLGSIVLVAIGALSWDWYIVELSALFLGMAVVCGLISTLSWRSVAEGFVDGAKDLTMAAVLVAFARGILVVAEDGRIIDTMLHGMAGALDGLGTMWAAQAMYGAQTVINFFVPSGSGQAALTMPVMAPLADLLSMNREIAILTFQFGDGFTNMIIPTNAVLVGILAAAKVEYGTWFRWMLPRQVLLFLLGMILIALAPL